MEAEEDALTQTLERRLELVSLLPFCTKMIRLSGKGIVPPCL